jgi:thiol-disulfide isomerase/thioredoxin
MQMKNDKLKLVVVLLLSTAMGMCAAEPAADDPSSFSGIGITIRESVSGAWVSSVLAGGAAFRSGEVHARDRITAVAEGDGLPVSIRGKSIEEVVALIRGKSGSEVRLTIVPADDRVIKEKVVALHRAAVSATLLKEMKAEVGKLAPDFSTTRLADKKVMALSDFAGKVVVLEFWATWCGPCQAPMESMQQYAKKNPKWGDRVVLMSMSVDRDLAEVNAHIKERDWNQTMNMRDTHGAASVYEVNAIPEVFIIDPVGIVEAKGHPRIVSIEAEVNKILKIVEPVPVPEVTPASEEEAPTVDIED